MPFVELAESPHAPGIRPVAYSLPRSSGAAPLIFLHGGWGYGVYPFRPANRSLQSQFRILIPDRSGYGRSTRVARRDARRFPPQGCPRDDRLS